MADKTCPTVGFPCRTYPAKAESKTYNLTYRLAKIVKKFTKGATHQLATSTPNKFVWKVHFAWSANVYLTRRAKKLSTPCDNEVNAQVE